MGDQIVRNEKDAKAGCDYLPHLQASPHVHRQEQRVHELDHNHSSQAEQDEVADPDPAVQVHGFLAVVPPPCMETFLHEIACAVLHQAAEHEAHCKDGTVGRFVHRDARKTVDGKGDQSASGTVYRKPRARQESAVYEPVVLEVLERHLNAPPHERICEEQQYYIYEVFHTVLIIQRIRAERYADCSVNPNALSSRLRLRT